MEYESFIQGKHIVTEKHGIAARDINGNLFDWQAGGPTEPPASPPEAGACDALPRFQVRPCRRNERVRSCDSQIRSLQTGLLRSVRHAAFRAFRPSSCNPNRLCWRVGTASAIHAKATAASSALPDFW